VHRAFILSVLFVRHAGDGTVPGFLRDFSSVFGAWPAEKNEGRPKGGSTIWRRMTQDYSSLLNQHNSVL
jgi:hypothetical protein